MVHLHTHSDMSQLDGCGRISEYVQVAKERGHKAVCFTEHGSMRGMYQLLLESNEKQIKPIFGIEFYVCADMHQKGLDEALKQSLSEGRNRQEFKDEVRRIEKLRGIRGDWHMTAWAKNLEGLRNLYKLSSKSWIEGFYYKPRIDLQTLFEHSEGVMIGSACCGGILNELVNQGREKTALALGDSMFDYFGEDLWLEIMPHNIREQVVANTFTIEVWKRWGKKARIIATQDAHYIKPEDWEHHEVLLAIGTGNTMSNPDRFRFSDRGFHFRTRGEMIQAFQTHHNYIPAGVITEALDNTVLFSDIVDCNLVIDRFKCLMPPIDLPDGYTDQYQYMIHLCHTGWEWRDIPGRVERVAKREGNTYEQQLQIYLDRLKMELASIKRQNFVAYFLLVHNLYQWVRSQGIACGPGRGSAAGSLVSFLIGITSVDPIEHKLLFERFISPDRIDMPDIDMDFEDVRRQEIIEYLRVKYGQDKVCQIATVGKLSGKQCLKDVARVLEVPFAEVNQVTASIIERSSGDERVSQTIEDSFKEFKVCREFDAKYPKVLHHAKRLEGLAKNLGIHAAGVVCSPEPLDNLIPLETRDSKNPIIVSAIDMYGIQAMGLLKMDVLGLRTMTVIRGAIEMIQEHHGILVDPERLDLNEPEVLAGFTEHDYVGVFQYDSPGADKICAGVKFTDFEDVAAMTALNRPGTARSGLATQYVARKKNPKLIKKTAFHPRVSQITSDTLGIIVYQEHVLKIFTEVAGFPPATADSLRKKIAKKWGDETIGKERSNFIKGAVKNTPGMTEEVAGKIMDAITFFGSYGFNKSHATAYGMIAYWCMWLKKHYPIEFYCSLLRQEPDRIRVQQVAKDAKKHDIEMLPPDVSASKMSFSIDRKHNAIRGSLCDIKFVGEAAAAEIMEHQPYRDVCDFIERAVGRKVHKRVVTALANAGALNTLVPNTKWFIEHMDEIWGVIKKAGWAVKLKGMLKASKAEPDWSEEEKILVASKVSPLAFGKHPIDAYSDFISKHIKVKIVDMSSESFFKDYHNKGVYVLGIIVEVKYNQVGDFHTGDLPSEAEKEKMGWGKRYANINVEDASGKQNRIKINYDIFDDYREIVDSGVGTPVILLAIPNRQHDTMRAQYMVNIETLRQGIEAGRELTIWERLVTGQHPTLTRAWKSKNAKVKAMTSYHKLIDRAHDEGKLPILTGVVTHLWVKKDKNLRDMAFFGLAGPSGEYIDVLCFSYCWDMWKEHIRPGMYASLQLDGLKDWYARKWNSYNKCLHLTESSKIWMLDSAKTPSAGKEEQEGRDAGAE